MTRAILIIVTIVAATLILPANAQAVQILPGDLLVDGFLYGPDVVTNPINPLDPRTQTYYVKIYRGSTLVVTFQLPSYGDLNQGRDGFIYTGGSNHVNRLDANGSIVSTLGPDPNLPRFLSFNRAGDLYAADTLGQTVRRFGLDGSLAATYTLGGGGAEGIDLAADQCTLYFTLGGSRAVKRWDVCRDVPLTPLASSLPGQFPAALRILPDGNLLVADGVPGIMMLDATGLLLRSYPLHGRPIRSRQPYCAAILGLCRGLSRTAV
ncbi:MAG: hypothetical protein ABI837_03035 [Acidobacteriota bacterium]